MSNQVKFAAALAVACVVLALDLATPRGITIGSLYVLPLAILLLLQTTTLGYVHAVAVVASAFTLLDLWLGPPGASLGVTVTNRALSLASVWLVAVLIVLERRRAAEVVGARAHAVALFDAALEAAPDAMLVVDDQGVIRAANGAASALYRYPRETLIGLAVARLVPERLRAAHADHMKGFFLRPSTRAMAPDRPVAAVRSDGTEVALETSLSVFDFNDQRMCIVSSRDVTEKRKLEERLRASQRMEAIGRLAGGVAHDFNNLLAVMISYSKLARDALGAESEARADLDEVLGAADRAAGLTRQLLAFSRRQVIAPRRFLPGELVQDMDKMLRRLIGENIELLTVRMPDEGLVEIDPSQLEQVVLNLVVNARDAMAGGGRLTLELNNVVLDASYCATHPDVTPGDYVMLAVTDTGIGMTDEVRVRVFEPFFSTKEAGAGTGLGLATVYGIVKQSRGHIWVYSEPGRGTTFKIYLPRAYGAAEERVVSRPDAAVGGHETVLLVEDEASLRRVAVRILRKAGYNVLEAANGLDALRKVEAGIAIDLLVTDVVMPMMGGRELALKLTEKNRGLRVIYLSGYTENAIVHHGVLDPGIVFLQKPFQPDDLLRRIREVLDSATGKRG